MGELYYKNGWLDGTLMHEAVHTSLDPIHAKSPGYKAAMAADKKVFVSPYAKQHPLREDFAETFFAWFILRFRTAMVEPELLREIRKGIPNRIAYFDENVKLDLSPNFALNDYDYHDEDGDTD